MVDLVAKTPAEGLLPLQHGDLTLSEAPSEPMTLLAPQRGKDLAAALKAAHGLSWPKPGRSSAKGGARALWFGLDQVLLTGVEADQALYAEGAVVDQSDAWCVLHLTGTGATETLARLVPVDLASPGFKRGHVIRTQINHMSGALTRLGPDAFELMVFRSMARTLVEELGQAMTHVSAR